MKLNVSKEWFQNRIGNEDYEIGAGGGNIGLDNRGCPYCSKPVTFFGRVKKGAMVIQHLEFKDYGNITEEFPTELEPVMVYKCDGGHMIYVGPIRQRKSEGEDDTN